MIKESEMLIPDSKKCGDCAYCEKCCSMFGAKPENRECDFHPVKFVLREIVK